MTIYLGYFDEKQKYPLLENRDNGYYHGFDVSNMIAIEISKLDIIVSAYNCESYEGDAFVLFKKDGKLYEVNDNHCSCNGLKNWFPEETTKEALLKRLESNLNGIFGVFSVFNKELREVIEKL